MIPLGYLAKRIARADVWFAGTPVEEVASVCGCISLDFADYVPYFRHNGYWMFDSPEAIREMARDERIDVVTYEHGNAPCHSPLTCNGLAQKLPVNRYGLLATCDEAKRLLEAGAFTSSEPGPHRILAVYSV